MKLRNILSRRNEQIVQSSSDFFNLQALPYEIVLKILIYLEIKNIVKMSQTSKKFHALCQENTLWQTASLSGKKYEFKNLSYLSGFVNSFVDQKAIRAS